MLDGLLARLAKQQQANLWREHQVRQADSDTINFNSNDYLGLSQHPDVKNALISAAKAYGVGSGSANTLSGYTQAHEDLSRALAQWLGRDKVLLFSSGYMANLAVLTTLPSSDTIIFADKLNHASLNDGMRFSEARFKRYPHNDLQFLNQALNKHPLQHKWIVSEGVFSMEGDKANLTELVKIAEKHQAQFMLDDVHGLGVCGETGAGSVEVHGLSQTEVPLLVGGFGKAFGTQGGFVAGSQVLMDALMQFARPYLFTTAMSPALAAATYASLKLIQTEKTSREHLQGLINYFKSVVKSLNLRLLPSDTPIQAIVFDTIEQVQYLSKALHQGGIRVSCVRYPTVPKDTPRLRISLTANHTQGDIDKLIRTLKQALINEPSRLEEKHC